MAFTRDRPAVVLSSAAALANAGLAWYWYGGLDGLDVATRTSARFSACVFAVALALRLSPSGIAWMRGFVGAHSVHYMTLLNQAIVDDQAHLHRWDIENVIVMMAGVFILLPLNAARYRMALFPIVPLVVALAIHAYRLNKQHLHHNVSVGAQTAS